ncbi:unnamed protein product [Rhizoctonia solani]|uniref:Uncharacterized protein n=1 Tax=Rhizoctonia solani TaxID=456999 RepID=A0A8H3BXS2_9AGAM|nr:unnamed protein product [Rhizoctonia solani]
MPPDAPPPPKRRKLTVAPKETTGSSSSIGNPTIANQFQVSQAATAQSGNPGRYRGYALARVPFHLFNLRLALYRHALKYLKCVFTSRKAGYYDSQHLEQQASIHREEYEALAMELEAVANFLQQHLNITRSSRILGVMSSVSRAIEKEVKLICEIRDGSHSRRIIHASKDEEVLVRVYRRVNELFSRLQVDRDWYGHMEHCKRTLGDDPDAKSVYLMNGMAGTGKTAIACSLAKLLEDDGRLELYLQEELACIEPSQSQITLLAKLAGNLFIFAATAVRYIRPEGLAVHSTERLNTILDNKFLPGSKRLAGIDSLYSTILASALENDDLEKQEIKRIYNILWTAVCIQEPVTIGTLAALAGLESADHASTSLESLRSVLHVSEHTGLVCILHASFPDYIFHCERSGRFFSDKGEKHRLLAHQCFKVMEQQLRFNICNLQTSYLFDHAVADLQERIESNIPAPLEYACQHWANHLCLAPVKHELCDALYAFLITKLLFWMEVLNLKQYHMTGLHALPNAQRWIAGTDAFHAFYDLPLFIHDATIFVTRFFVAQRLLRSVKFSPDGIKVASGSDDGSVCIWDPTTGALMLGPLEGYADIIWSIDFSPDSKLLVSGSNDGTLCGAFFRSVFRLVATLSIVALKTTLYASGML